MKKSDLLKPGEYAATPLVVLARGDLTATAKNVYTALASHLHNGNAWVWPSVARLAGMIAASQTAVRAAIHALENAALIELDRQNGKVTRYGFLPPTPTESDGVNGPTPTDSDGVNCLTPSESDGVDAPTPTESDGVNGPTPSESVPTPSEFVPTPSESEGEVLKEVLKETLPPLPPPRGGCAGEVFSGGNSKEESSGQKPKSQAEIVVQCDVAHRKAFGKPLPAKWKRDIRTEYDDGDRAALVRIDAKVMRGAEDYRVANGWTCLGHGTVMQYLNHLDRNAGRKQKFAQGNADSAARQARQATEEAEEQAKEKQRQDVRLEHLRSLPAQQRAGYVEQVTRELRFTKRTDLIERQAALLAWEVYEQTNAAVEI